MKTTNNSDFTGHKHNQPHSFKVDNHNKKALSTHGSFNSVSENDIILSTVQDFQSTPTVNDKKL